jgi:ribose transport system substrate-binding protein
LITAACQPRTAAGTQTLTIALIPKALDSPVFDVSHQGALQRAAELSARKPVKVEVFYTGSIAADAAEQVRILEDAVARGVDAVAISCIDPTACIDPINRAVAAGIPVMTWDSDSPQSKRFTYLGVDNYLAGRVAGNLLVSALRGRGQVAILTGVPGAQNLEERIRGCLDVISLFDEIEVVATVASNEDINQGVQVLEETMQAYPDMDGWFFTGAWPLLAERGSMPLWEAASLRRGMKTIAFDTLPVELELLKDGYLSGLVGQKYWDWGYVSIQIIYDHLIYGRNYLSFVDSGIDIVLLENVEPMLQAWDSNDFSRPQLP